jgi:ankyrin repeat protein
MEAWTPPNSKYPPPKVGEPALHRAARLGDDDAIRALVAAGADVDELFEINLDPGSRPAPASPLMVAAGSADGASAATVDLLLTLRASIEPRAGLSALPYACLGLGWNYPPGGDAGRVAALLAAGADVEARAGNGASALACASRSGDPARVALLLQAGADPMPACVEDRGGHPFLFDFRDPLRMAAASGAVEAVRLLLDAGADVHRYPADEDSVLSCAGSLAVLEALLSADADPLHLARGRRSVVEDLARNGAVPIEERVDMLHMLIDAGADIDAAGGSPPLSSAAMAFADDAVEALLRAGADPNVQPSPLGSVCFSWSDRPRADVDRIIDLLVEAGVDPDASDRAGLRPLHTAMSPDTYGPGFAESDGFNEAATLALLRVGASIDITWPETGYRPLHAAAAAGSIRCVRALLEEGADPDEQADDGSTPADVARAAGAHHCEEALDAASARRSDPSPPR